MKWAESPMKRHLFSVSIRLRFSAACLLVVLAVVAPATFADGRADRNIVQLADSWKAFYAGDIAKAAELTEPLLKSRSSWASSEAYHIRARCEWQFGSAKSRKKADRIWSILKKRGGRSNTTRLQIAESLKLAGSKDPAKAAKAIALLAGIVKARPMGTVTGEAGIELAKLYARADRMDDAKQTLKFVTEYLKKTTALEISPVSAKVFSEAAGKLIKTLKPPKALAAAAFGKAGQLLKKEKFREAYLAYGKVITEYSASDYAPHSILLQGDCLLGDGLFAQAIK
ncbi:MAG TPA: hypothetical protein ENL03_05235, partial [Phycisphaerae bacterium]|nr:hypothetical protein [Phycisphaerae bacterium]